MNKAYNHFIETRNNLEIGGKCLLPSEDHSNETVYKYEQPTISIKETANTHLYVKERDSILPK